MKTLNTPLIRSLLAGLAGFVAYGSWASFANWPHGEAIALRSGLVQGSYSLVLTLSMTLVTEWLHNRFINLPGTILWVMLIVCPALFTTAYVINMIAGTPEILMTILPGFVIGSVYTLVYLMGLQRIAAAVYQLPEGS